MVVVVVPGAREDVRGAAAKATVRVLARQDPGAQAAAVCGGEEGALLLVVCGRGGGGEQVDCGDDEEAEGQALAVVGRVVVGQQGAGAALPVAEVAGFVEGRVEG